MSLPRAYRPLRPGTLLWQTAVVVAAETALYLSYASFASHFHWATHFLVGLTAASLWQAAVLLVVSRPTRFPVLSVLGFHLWAMWPDLAFRAGLPHYPWMDPLSLGHVSAHYLPGGDDGWLVVALIAAGCYALLLWRWLAARTAEAALGLPPAFGMGGAAVVRPQRDPRTAVLVHERLGPVGRDVVLLLHGLGASSTTWMPTARQLAGTGLPVLVPDLLGFGSSMRIGTQFGLEHQVAALLRLLDEHDVGQAHVVGHSWGCAVAAALAQRAPERVARLTLVAPAVFADPTAARARLSARSFLTRSAVQQTRAGVLLCDLMCLLRPVLTRLAPWVEPDVPPEVARAGVQHTYTAYREALAGLFESNPLPALLADPPRPVTLVLAEDDTTVPVDDVLALPRDAAVQVVRVPGGHGIAYEAPATVADVVLRQPRPQGVR